MKCIASFLTLVAALFLISSCGKKDKKVDNPVTIITATVTTSAVSEITNSGAKAGGNVTDAGNGQIVARGICWSVNQFPNIVENNKTIDGAGTGEFISGMSNLQSNVTYYVRAYATNEVGTAYGDNVKFTTSPFASFRYNGETIFLYPTDNGSSVWGPEGVSTGAISPVDGQGNTTYINNQTGDYAAKVCADLVAYGYNDWYLPSAGELDYMYQSKSILGGFTNVDYWSSTETSAQGAASQNFQNGSKLNSAAKGQVKNCRCVRK